MSLSGRLEPERPSLGPLFAGCVAAWAACFAMEALGWGRYCSSGEVPASPLALAVLATISAAMVALIALRRGRARRNATKRRTAGAVVPVACLVCGLVCSGAYWASWETGIGLVQDALGKGEGLQAELVGDPATRDYGIVSAAQSQFGTRTVAFRILWPKDARPLKAGHRIRLEGSLSAPKPDEGGRWNHQQGYAGMVDASRVSDEGSASGLRGLVCAFREDSAGRIFQLGGEGNGAIGEGIAGDAAEPTPAAGLLAGVVLGDRAGYAGTELEQDFRTTGLAHLMAVSGSHLAVVMALLSWIFARLPLARRIRACLVAGSLVLYVALTGFAPSACRAFAMCASALAAGLIGRRGHVVSGLSLCVLVFVCAEPPLAFSLGFLLSVLAVFGLVVLSPLAVLWLRHLLPGRLAGLADSVGATLSATLVTLPATVPVFAQLPLVSPLATLLAAPVVTLAMGLGILGVLLAATGLPGSCLLLQVALAASGGCAALVHLLADLPLACIPISSAGVLVGAVFGLLVAGLWVVWPLPKAPSASFQPDSKRDNRVLRPLGVGAAFLLPLALVVFEGMGGAGTVGRALAPEFTSPAQVVMVDVGQGDCMLVRDGGAAVLIDTGADGRLLEQGLARQGITHLDAVYVTHKDADHCGALPALTGVVSVGHVFVHRDLLASPVMGDVLEDARWVTAGRGAEGVHVGTRTRVGRFSLTLLAPQEGGESENDDSLVNLLEYDEDGDGSPEARGLLTGDAEAEATAPLAASIGHVDLLKVAHHGSRGGATDAELATLRPSIALIGVGADNTYGHPTREALSQLAAVGAHAYRTDLHGDVTVSFAGKRMSVKLQKGRAA